ncbi:Probable transmembrane protein [Caballeronia glathei]|jgi:branched-subunit amino acid transport protein|uniref:Branched-chain amino acid transporter n=1 Tax=Caballeronia glathei TaxID=60547 RepID=A0A069PR53_9BURK|nr:MULTISPECIES: AzlD domain-containing protein [Burkholderiaceae]KDR39766.1 branched-chain amino acid transporter [Caballeronia glathei]TCK44626.1 branched-subunit amino acid transport protein [Paraburkholderia sp. BL8N3]CDY79926.1 Probable transmembrane protein [Caballeronia glathei]
MSTLQIWLAIIGMGLITALTRALFLIGGERMILPDRLQRALRYAPAAALAAVVIPDVLQTPDGLSVALSNHALYASLAGLAWYLWRRSMLGTIIVGMLVFTLLRLFT